MAKFLRKWWFLISTFAVLGGSAAAWGVKIDTQMNMEDKFVPREEIMLRFDMVEIRQAETNVRLKAIMDYLEIEDAPLQSNVDNESQ
jgi:hypothetical protein